MRKATVIALIISVALCSSCSLGTAQTTERPLPTDTPQPTFTTTLAPTDTTSPSSTPEPTDTPRPTDTPEPTATPTPTATPRPTDTPQPTATVVLPTATRDPCYGATYMGARDVFTFGQIVPCLDTPEEVSAFMAKNIRWDGNWDPDTYGDNAYASAQEVYRNGVDDCDGLAEFAACVLHMNGFEAYNVGISIIGPLGHNVAGYIGSDGLKHAINNGYLVPQSFETWEGLAQYFTDGGYAAPDGVLYLFNPCIEGQIGQSVVKDVFTIPHEQLR